MMDEQIKDELVDTIGHVLLTVSRFIKTLMIPLECLNYFCDRAKRLIAKWFSEQDDIQSECNRIRSAITKEEK